VSLTVKADIINNVWSLVYTLYLRLTIFPEYRAYGQAIPINTEPKFH